MRLMRVGPALLVALLVAVCSMVLPGLAAAHEDCAPGQVKDPRAATFADFALGEPATSAVVRALVVVGQVVTEPDVNPIRQLTPEPVAPRAPPSVH